MKKLLQTLVIAALCTSASAETFQFGTRTNPEGRTFEVDQYGFVVDGRHVLPVMGEMHYSRVPASDWRRELRKMKAGGITVLATYVFWNHHEAEEGRWDWTGNRNLHEFVRLCAEEGLPVVLRVGPFCHGEVWQGGFPDWAVERALADPRQYKLRSLAPGFMAEVQSLYSNIYAQVNDLMWKNGGPIVGMQIENECRGPWAYYKALKEMAVRIGFDLPFYTRTGWPKLNGREEFGQMLPLYGDYADGFWDRDLTDMPGNYNKAFLMKETRLSDVIATEALGKNQDTRMERSDLQYPYLTCELGGGMMTSYHRRLNMSGNEALPLAICKLGSGSNLPGYYMYHGGSNPLCAAHSMAECQASRQTNHNDMPHISYDFQCPLGEMGQPNTAAFHQTRWLHQMLADWGEELATMSVDSLSDHYALRGCFVFRNDYVRLLNEEGEATVTPEGMTITDERIRNASHQLTLSSSTLQPFAKADGGIYLIPTRKARRLQLTVDGKTCTMKADQTRVFDGLEVTVLSRSKAQTAYVIDHKMHYAQHGGILYQADSAIVEEWWEELPAEPLLTCEKLCGAGALREVKKGAQKVAEQPADSDFAQAMKFRLTMASVDSEAANDLFLDIRYEGDCARLYADGQLIEDNFWNGKPMLARLADCLRPDGTLKQLELCILPLGKDYPIYLQKEQRALLDAAPDGHLCNLRSVSLLKRCTI